MNLISTHSMLERVSNLAEHLYSEEHEMKKLFFWGVAMVFGMSMFGCSSQPAKNSAEDAVMVDGKKILITENLNPPLSMGRFLHSKDLPNGIFIRASNSGDWNRYDDLPNAVAIIRELFVANGFKVADKQEDASLTINFVPNGSMSMIAANDKAAHSNLPGTTKVISSIGAIAAGVATGGVAAGMGYIAGAFIPTDEHTNLTGFISGGKDGLQIWTAGIKYRLEKEDKAPEDAVLKMMTTQWIKRYMVLDTAPVAESPASSVVAVGTASEAKK